MSLLSSLIDIYRSLGYEIRTGLNSYHFSDNRDAPFTFLYKDGEPVATGGGLSIQELYFLENLQEVIAPKSIFVIGNAFGWSTIALSLLFPDAHTVAIDACVEGDDNFQGLLLTNIIAKNNNLNLKAIMGRSPDDIGIIKKELGMSPFNLVLIDGLHTNKQLLLDFNSCIEHSAADCIFLLHDVINFNLKDSYSAILVTNTGLTGQILDRTPSGITAIFPKNSSIGLRNCLDNFSETSEIKERVSCDLAFNLLSQKNYSKAQQIFTEQISRNPEWELPYVGYMRALRLDGKKQELHDYLKSLEAASKSSPPLTLEYIYSLIDDENYDAAFPILLSLITNNNKISSDVICEAHYLSGICNMGKGDYITAETDFLRALKIKKNLPHALHSLSIVYQSLNDHSKALESVHQALEISPYNELYWYELGNIKFNQQEYIEAEEFFLKAIRFNDDFIPPFHSLAVLYRHQEKYEEAHDYISMLLKKAPNNALYHFDLGTIFHLQNRLEEAIQPFLQAISLDPNFYKSHHFLGNIYKLFNKYDDAETHLISASQLAESDDYTTWYDLGCLYFDTQSHEKAIRAYKKSLDINHDFAPCHHKLGFLYSRSKKYDKAHSHYRQAIDLDPHNWYQWFDYGGLLLDTNRIEDAKEAFTSSLKYNDSFPDTYHLLGVVFRLLQESEKAAEMITLALEKNSQHHIYHYDLGLTKVQLKAFDEAEQCFKKAISLHAKWKSPYKELISLYKILGKTDEESFYKHELEQLG